MPNLFSLFVEEQPLFLYTLAGILKKYFSVQSDSRVVHKVPEKCYRNSHTLFNYRIAGIFRGYTFSPNDYYCSVSAT